MVSVRRPFTSADASRNPLTHKLPTASDEVDRREPAAAGDRDRSVRARPDGREASVGKVPHGPCPDGWGGTVSPVTDYGVMGFSRIDGNPGT